MNRNHLLKTDCCAPSPEFLIQQVLYGAWELAFFTSSQGTLMLPIWGPHFHNHRSSQRAVTSSVSYLPSSLYSHLQSWYFSLNFTFWLQDSSPHLPACCFRTSECHPNGFATILWALGLLPHHICIDHLPRLESYLTEATWGLTQWGDLPSVGQIISFYIREMKIMGFQQTEIG